MRYNRISVFGTVVWEGTDAHAHQDAIGAVNETLKVTGNYRNTISYGKAYSEDGRDYWEVAIVKFE